MFEMDHISAARLDLLFPALAQKVRQMAEILFLDRSSYAQAAADCGIAIRVVQGLRTWNEQQALYEQGRSREGKVVTNARGGYSYHNFGLAVDCVPSTHGPGQPYDPDWNASHPAWKRMEEVGRSLGLDSGATWRSFPDAPHFQLVGKFPQGAPNDEVRRLYQSEGMDAVWRVVEAGL